MLDALSSFWMWLEDAIDNRWLPVILASSYLLTKILLRHFAARLFPPAPLVREMLAWLGVDLLVLSAASSVAAQIGGRFAVTSSGAVIWYSVVVLDLFCVYCLYLAFRKNLNSGQSAFLTFFYPWLGIFLGLGPYFSIFALLVRADGASIGH